MYEKITRWYTQRLWTTDMVQKAIDKGVITIEQFNDIISKG